MSGPKVWAELGWLELDRLGGWARPPRAGMRDRKRRGLGPRQRLPHGRPGQGREAVQPSERSKGTAAGARRGRSSRAAQLALTSPGLTVLLHLESLPPEQRRRGGAGAGVAVVGQGGEQR